jgi:hypothetical protein
MDRFAGTGLRPEGRPVQVYLDASDRALLAEVARRTGLSKAEILRRGLRSVAEHLLAERAPGWSMDRLIGALGDDRALPRDLASRHDESLYGAPRRGHRGHPG